MINIFAPINPTGYGTHAINFIGALSKLTDVRLYLKGNFDYEGKHKEALEKCVQNGREDFKRLDAGICLWHASDMATFTGEPRIGYTVFELDRLKPNEIKHLESCDFVWVASNWARDIVLRDLEFHEHDHDCVVVIPEGVDPELFPYIEKPREMKDRPRLLNIGKFEVRKGHLHILEYLKNTTYPIDFIAHWFNMFMPMQQISQLIQSFGFRHEGKKHLDKDEITPKIMCDVYGCDTEAKLWVPCDFIRREGATLDLIKQADFGVFPYSAEGWNLPLIECMATGLPCIATNYSGPTEYLTEDNAVLLENINMMPAQDGRWFHGEGEWAAIDPEEFKQKIEVLRTHNRKEIRENLRGFNEKWSWENAANIAMKELELVQ